MIVCISLHTYYMLPMFAVLLFIAWKCLWASSLLLVIYLSNPTDHWNNGRGITLNNLSAAILSWKWWTGARYWSLCGLYVFITRIIGMCGFPMVYILCKSAASKAPRKGFFGALDQWTPLLGHTVFAQHTNCKPRIHMWDLTGFAAALSHK